VDDPDEFDAMEIALEDEPDEFDEDSALVFGLKGDGCPVNRRRGCYEYFGSGIFRGRVNRREQITYPKREECEYPLLKLSPKRRLSRRREVRVKRDFAWTSREVKIQDCSE